VLAYIDDATYSILNINMLLQMVFVIMMLD
jgi:hypothetical protein